MTEKSRQVYDLMVHKGYPEGFAAVVASEMHTDFTAGRMLGYIAANKVLPLEVVADEMLAILSDRDKLVDKHVSEYAQGKINELYRDLNE